MGLNLTQRGTNCGLYRRIIEMPNGRLIIVSNHHLFREGLKHVLEAETLKVVCELTSAPDVLPFLRSADGGADLIVYDQPAHAEDYEALREIIEAFPKIGIIVLAEHIHQTGFDMAISGGACGFLPKSISSKALALSLQLLLLGENLFAAPASLATRAPVTTEFIARCAPAPLRSPLSAREGEILECLKTGSPNKVIARRLNMAEATVKVHVKSLLRKIEVGNRTQAAVWALSQEA
jgi:two-component system nitrate/nitrite response regulator NarL